MQASRERGANGAVLRLKANRVVRVTTGAEHDARSALIEVTISAGGAAVFSVRDRKDRVMLKCGERL